MDDSSQDTLRGRLLAALAALLFAGGALWIGADFGAGPPSRPDRGAVSPFPAPAAAARLAIIAGPEVGRDPDGRWQVQWRTNVAADSLVTYGRADATDYVAAKSTAPATDHRLLLPADPFAPLCRIRVMSATQSGQTVAATLAPGGTGQPFRPAAGRYGEPAATGPAEVAAWEDLDGDGRAELAVCRPSGAGLVLISAAGALNLASGRCDGLYWADFNDDGRADLLATGERPTVYVRVPGEGLRFASAEPKGVAAVFRAAVADCDGDGRADFVGFDPSGALILYSRTPEPLTFVRREVALPPGGPAASAAAVIPADFTGDGRMDLCLIGHEVRLLAGTADGFEPLPGAVPDAVRRFGAACWAEPADWDGDGNPDLLVAGPDGAGCELLRNDGSGRFEAATAAAGELAALDVPLRCGVWADFDGNGWPDVMLGPVGGGLRFYLNAGGGGFMDAAGLVPLPVPAGSAALHLSAADLNGDGAPDLCASLEADGTLFLENAWWEEPARAYLAVRPAPGAGAWGSAVCLRDAAEAAVLGSARIPARGDPQASGPSAWSFGVRYLDAATVEVAFSDGVRRSQRWRSGQARLLVVPHPPGVRPAPSVQQ